MRVADRLWWFGYYLRGWRAVLRYVVMESLPWRVAWLLPRKVALFAFVRVYAVIGRCGPDYAEAYEAWEAGKGR